MATGKIYSVLTFYLTVAVAAIFLSIPLMYNGFPIVTSDSGTYIRSAFTLVPPDDRPITYSLLIRIFCLDGYSLFGPVIVQVYTMAWLLAKITKKSLLAYNSWYFLCFIALLSVTTGLAWTTCQLMCDIYTPMAVLCLVLLLPGSENTLNNVILFTLYYIAVATHASHFLLFLLLIFVIVCCRKLLFKNNIPAGFPKTMLVLVVLTALTFPALKYPVNRSSHVFFMAAMTEHGITKKFLDEQCPTNNYKLCKYKDSLPAKAFVFIWDANSSPINKMGGWDSTREDFNKIIHATLTRPRYITMHISASLKATLQQLYSFGVADGNLPNTEGSGVYDAIQKYFPSQLSRYMDDSQNFYFFPNYTEQWNRFFNIVIAAFAVILLILSFKKNLYTPGLRILLFVTIASIVINAWDCGTFANAIDRLGCKMIWMVPFCALLLLANLQTKLLDHRSINK